MVPERAGGAIGRLHAGRKLPRPMKYYLKRAIVLSLGIAFLLLGIVGLALPFLQGFLFIAIGLLLLSFFWPALHLWVESHTRRWPKLHEAVGKAHAFIHRIIGE